MDWSKIASSAGDVLGAVVPAIGAALGGPLGGAAGAAICSVFGLGEGSTEDDVVKALRTASPDKLLELKQREAELKVDAARLGVDLEAIAAKDRASAREREVRAQDKWTPRLLAMMTVAGFFGCIAWIMVRGLPTTGGEALLLLLGTLGATFSAVITYYFGSSAGSAAKTGQVDSLMKKLGSG